MVKGKFKKNLLLLSLILAVFVFSIACSSDNIHKSTAVNNEEVWDTVRDAYIYTFPLVIANITGESLECDLNHLQHTRALSTPDFKIIVTPNVDTLYSSAFMNLKEDAMVLKKPETDRYCSIQILDVYTNGTTILNSIAETKEERTYLITGPDFKEDVPKDMVQVKMPTNSALMLVRIIVDGEEDIKNANALQDKLVLTKYKANKADVPFNYVVSLSPLEYFNLANKYITLNPPPEDDKEIIEKISKINVGENLTFDMSILGNNIKENWESMLKNMIPKLVESSYKFQTKNGAWVFFGHPIADFSKEYEYRALVAIAGFGANPVSESVYLRAEIDANGERITGENSYTVHFEKDLLPPAKKGGFWSVTAYGEDDFLIENPINRYVLNDRSKLVYNDDGSLDILVQKEQPKDKKMLANWLPIKDGEAHLFLRIYLPEEKVIKSEWKAPSIIKNNL